MLLFLTGCMQTEVSVSDNSHTNEVVEVLQKHQIERTSFEENIFTSKLNGVTPKAFKINQKPIVI